MSSLMLESFLSSVIYIIIEYNLNAGRSVDESKSALNNFPNTLLT